MNLTLDNRTQLLAKGAVFLGLALIWLYAAASAVQKSSLQKFALPVDNEFIQKSAPWMPASWTPALLREIRMESFAFSESLPDMIARLSKAPWVAHVSRVQRDFKGGLELHLELQRPVCVFRNNQMQKLGAESGVFLPMLVQDGTFVLDETGKAVALPLVQGEAIVGVEEHRVAWFKRTIDFINEWNRRADVRGRLFLERIELKSHETEKSVHLLMTLHTVDTKFKHETVVEWGELSEYSIIDDKPEKDKWRDLELVLQRGTAFNSLELRFKNAGIFLRSEAGQ